MVEYNTFMGGCYSNDKTQKKEMEAEKHMHLDCFLLILGFHKLGLLVIRVFLKEYNQLLCLNRRKGTFGEMVQSMRTELKS